MGLERRASAGIMTGDAARLVGSRFENHGIYPSRDWTAWSVPGISSPNLTCGTGEDTPHTVHAVPHMARARPHGKVSNSCFADYVTLRMACAAHGVHLSLFS